MAVPTFALPGDALAPTSTHTAGAGTHAYNGHLYASVTGPVTTSPGPGGKKAMPRISVGAVSATTTTPLASQRAAVIPSVGDIVYGRITRTNPRQATLDILALSTAPADDVNNNTSTTVALHSGPFAALIRQQDVRATEVDKVKVAESFRVGDVVRGVVVSLGDERNYYVSTARNEFGVVLARSEGGAGNAMLPVSWKAMRDAVTGVEEARKVAKVF